MASTSFGGFAAAARQQPNAREISKSRRRTASASSGARRTRGASRIEGEYHRDHHHYHHHHHQERIQRRGEVTTARATKAAVEDSLPSGFVNEAIRAEPKAYPPNRSYQQTVKKAFVVSGFGLHSGEDEIVRICPAYANEGRYFVRVSDDSIENETSEDELSDAQVNKLLLERARAMLSNDPSDRKEILKNQSILRSEDEEKIDSPGDFLGNQG